MAMNRALIRIVVLPVALVVIGAPVVAAQLREPAVRAWRDHVQQVTARRLAEDQAGWTLAVGAPPAGRTIDVEDGLINEWRGAVLVPGAKLAPVLVELQSLAIGKHRQADVLDARVLWREGDASKIYLKLMRKKVVTVTYNTEHDVRYERLGQGRARSTSIATRIAELENAGTPTERERPVGDDRGFLWRLNSYWRYQQVPEGVIIELESLTLSRAIPFILKPLASPLVASIGRESLTRTLESVRTRLLAAATAR